MSSIREAKQRLPLPALMHRLGLDEHAKKSARCLFHDDQRNSFSVWQKDGAWFWKCHAGCGGGDEINFLELHKQLSRRGAIKLFLEMAGVAKMGRDLPGQKSNGENPKPVDWQRCVAAFTEKHLERLAEWRGYSGEFCSWLHKAGFVGLWRKRVAGLWQNCIAFPVHDRARKVVAVHYWQKEDGNWRYCPLGAKVRPLIVGELIAGEPVHVFESQWDCFGFLDVSGERSGVIITRGASNGALVADLISERSTVYVWTQNDAAGEKWQKDICANTKAAVKRAKIPAPHKDLNDWTRAGATARDLLAAMTSAEAIGQLKVDLAAVLDSICDFLRRYVRFSSPAQPTAIALWIAHTWALDAFDYSPYLHIQSPEKRCGKTRVLDCIELIASKPWRAISPTEAVLFRKIEAHKPTLLLDEIDAVFSNGKDERKEPLRALLNAGFERKAKVPRCAPHSFQIQDFQVFCAKAFAGIGRLPDTISDRCIPISLVRRSRDESVERFRKRDVESMVVPTHNGLAEWAAKKETIEKLRSARPDILRELSDRQSDICEPLLAIADLAGSEWPERARRALLELCVGESDEDESKGVKLLSAIREVFDATNEDRIATKELLEQLVSQDTDAPWASWWEHDLKVDNVKGPGARLAKLLKPYRIKARPFRSTDGTTRGYMREDFLDAWQRYCPPKTA
jgi:hypothetical protein